MESRVHLQPAYVLHRHAFQNTSLLVDFFTIDYGRVRGVAKGARAAKSKYRSLLQLFHPLLVSFTGKGEMKTVTTLESGHGAIKLEGQRLFSGMYINELLARLMLNHVEHKSLYKNYQDALIALQGDESIEIVLRRFELALLSELGYGINLDSDCHSHEAIASDQTYRFTPDIGFELSQEDIGSANNARLFRGEHIQAIGQMQIHEPDAAKSAKRLLRIALNAHLGEKPLMSRSLFLNRES
jgi:DNA repair protein RecO (recombination protein O)